VEIYFISFHTYHNSCLVRFAGIIPYANGLLIAHFGNGGVYYLDLADESIEEVVPVGSAPSADGLVVSDDNLLYIAQGVEEKINVWKMSNSGGSVTSTFERIIESDNYDSPATCDLYGDKVYSVNAAFRSLGDLPAEGEDDLATFDEEFEIVGVDTSAPTSGSSKRNSVVTVLGALSILTACFLF